MEITKSSNRAVNLRSTINAIISETIDGGTPQSFTYDDVGRLTDDGTLSYTWDRDDRLLKTEDGVTTINYEYNGLGHRVKQDTTVYLLDTVQGLPRVIADKTGSTVNNYVFSDHGLLRHQKPDSSWVHPLRDGLGSVRHIVDASLDPVYSVNHTPYGERWNAQGTSPMPFGFTGEWQDPNDLLYLRARYYNPAQAAFLSLDPLEGGLGDIKSLNRYGYVVANPANFVDPSGLLFETPPIGCGGGLPGQTETPDNCTNLDLDQDAERKCSWLEWFYVQLTEDANTDGDWTSHQVREVYNSVYTQAVNIFNALLYGASQPLLHHDHAPAIHLTLAFRSAFKGYNFELRMEGDPVQGSALTTVTPPTDVLIRIFANGQINWGSDSSLPVTFSESLVAHEMGHAFSAIHARQMQILGRDSLAQQILDQYARDNELDFQGNVHYLGGLSIEQWNDIGQLLPRFAGGDPRESYKVIVDDVETEIVNEGRSWSRGNAQQQPRELAAEAYAAWSLGYLDSSNDVFGIAASIKRIIRQNE